MLYATIRILASSRHAVIDSPVIIGKVLPSSYIRNDLLT